MSVKSRDCELVDKTVERLVKMKVECLVNLKVSW